MLKNLMEDKRLDFDAPLLSVRRLSAPGADATADQSASNAGESGRDSGKRPPPAPRRASLPFYKSELKSGPVRNPGVVPFVWEQTPGQPKDGPRPLRRPPAVPRLPPARISNGKKAQKPVASVRTYRRPIAAVSSESTEGGGQKAEEQQEPIQEDRRDEDDDDDDDDDDDEFSDAVETLSRTESFFMNCSVSGLSGVPDAIKLPSPSGSFATDPQVRDFMMGRFLPAAQAMAVSSPQCAPRKPRQPMRLVEREGNGDYRRPLPQCYQYGLNLVPQHGLGQLEDEGDSYEDEDYADSGHLPSKACGLFPRFCFNSSFCLLNPVPGMKVRSRLPPPPKRRIGGPQIPTLQHQDSPGQVEDENSWEAVYEHRLGNGSQDQVEDGSKLTSESNHLSNWSDSQMADGSSPHCHSTGSGISPYRNEAPYSPFHEGKGFLGVPKSGRKISGTEGSNSCEKDSENHLDTTLHDGSQQGSGTMSPEIEKTLYIDTVHRPETPHSKSSSVASNAEIMLKPADKDSEVGVVSHGMEDGLILETSGRDGSQPKVSKLVEPHLSVYGEIPDHGDVDDATGFKNNDGNDGSQPLKAEDQIKNYAGILRSLLPPPLPKSPSESWLCRTLPSVSSKNPRQQSFLGIQFQHRKQALQAASNDPKAETDGKPVKVHRQIRFADMLTKPLSLESEI